MSVYASLLNRTIALLFWLLSWDRQDACDPSVPLLHSVTLLHGHGYGLLMRHHSSFVAASNGINDK